MSTRILSSAVALVLAATASSALAQEAPAPLQPLPGSSPPAAAPAEPVEEPRAPRTVVIPGGAAASTSASAPPPAIEPDRREAPAPISAAGVKLGLGLAVGYVPSSGFDTFASNDTLAQLSLDGTYALLSQGRLAFAAGLGWDVGGRGSKLRGLDASLFETSFRVPLEGRYAVTRGVWGLLRVAPGATYLVSHLGDPSAPARLSDAAWAFSVDASVGAAFLLGSTSSATKKTPRFVLQPEVGYRFATAASLAPSPSRDAKDVIGSDASTRIADVSLSGFFWRATVGLAF